MPHAKWPPKWLVVLIAIVYSMLFLVWTLLDKVLNLRSRRRLALNELERGAKKIKEGGADS